MLMVALPASVRPRGPFYTDARGEAVVMAGKGRGAWREDDAGVPGTGAGAAMSMSR